MLVQNKTQRNPQPLQNHEVLISPRSSKAPSKCDPSHTESQRQLQRFKILIATGSERSKRCSLNPTPMFARYRCPIARIWCRFTRLIAVKSIRFDTFFFGILFVSTGWCLQYFMMFNLFLYQDFWEISLNFSSYFFRFTFVSLGKGMSSFLHK